MTEYLTELGIGGIFALILVREFLRYTEQNNAKKKSHCLTEERLREIERQINQLYEMHKVYDKDGAPIWYRKTAEFETLLKVEHGVNNLRQVAQALTQAVTVLNQKGK